MQIVTFNAICLIAICALSTGATAQITYKCGDSYSQTPCPGAVVIDTADNRTAEQKLQADSATGRDARIAAAMQKTRIEQEKRDLAANARVPTKVKPERHKKTADKLLSFKGKKPPIRRVAKGSVNQKQTLSSKKSSLKKVPLNPDGNPV